MKRLISHTILVLLFVSPVFAQPEQSNESLFYDGVFFYEEDLDYMEAQYIFKKLLKSEPDNAHVMFLLGMCYNNIEGSESEGIPYFMEATKYITLNFKQGKYDEKRAPQHTWFYLAEAYRLTNQTDLALEALNEFKNIKDFEGKYNARITDDAVEAIERAKIIVDQEISLRSMYFNEPINSTDDDYNGVISGDGKTLVWANSKTFYEAVYMSKREDGGQWSPPVLITPQIVSDGDLFPTGLSFDGSSLLLLKKPKRGNTDIWISRFNGTLWSPAEPLEGDINTSSIEDHASFSPSGKRIYFSSDRRGGQGGLDIWHSDRASDGTWGNAINMGTVINTDKDETCGYMTPDNTRFIFASTAHFNMGGYDIFRSELDEKMVWKQPKNMGYPINTTADNTYYVPLGSGMQAIYTRFTTEGIGKRDLWFVEILDDEESLDEIITVEISTPGLSEKDFALIVIDEDTGEEFEILYDAETDSFKALGGPGKKLKVISYKQK